MKQIYHQIKNREPVSIYYAGTFISSFAGALTFAVYTIFLIKNGMNLFEVNLINTIFMLAIIFLEVPTGAISDLIGRKRAVLASSVLAILGFLLYPTFRNIYNFALAETLIALSMAFSYGAFEAWMVDSSQERGFSGKFDYVFSQANVYSKVAGVVGGVIGAYLATVNIALPFYIGAFITIFEFMFLSAFMISDNKPILGINLRHSFAKLKEIVVTSIKYSTKHKVLLWVLLGGAVFSLAMQPLNMYWAPKFNTMLGDKIYLMGWIWATLSILALAGSYMTKVLVQNEKKYSFIVALSILTIFVSILISSSFYIIAISLAGYLVHEIGRGLYQPIQLAYMNNYADKEKRATIISFESMTSSFGAVIGLIVFGLIAQKTSIETTWFIASFAVLLALPFYFKADAT